MFNHLVCPVEVPLHGVKFGPRHIAVAFGEAVEGALVPRVGVLVAAVPWGPAHGAQVGVPGLFTTENKEIKA